MKNVFTILFIFLFSGVLFSQQINTISSRCPAPNQRDNSSVRANVLGDITYIPCPTRTSIFSGNVDFSGATVTGLVAGSGTINFIPRFTAASTIGNTPFSWDGTSYVFNNTALNSEFRFDLTPSATGIATIGDSTGASQHYFQINRTTGISTLRNDQGDIVITTTAGGGTGFLTGDASAILLNTTGGGSQLSLTANTTAAVFDLLGNGNASLAAAGQLDLNATTWNAGASGTMALSSTGNTTIRTGTTAGVSFTAATGITTLGDLTGAGSSLFIDDTGQAQLFGATETILGGAAGSIRATAATDTLSTSLSIWNLAGVANFQLNRTITAAGTTGNQVINLPAGTVNFAAGASTITVTSSIVTADSIILGIARRNDATCAVKAIEPGAGSFVITMTANCTAETSVGFWVTN